MKKKVYQAPSFDVVSTTPAACLLIGSDPVIDMSGDTDGIGLDIVPGD